MRGHRCWDRYIILRLSFLTESDCAKGSWDSNYNCVDDSPTEVVSCHTSGNSRPADTKQMFTTTDVVYYYHGLVPYLMVHVRTLPSTAPSSEYPIRPISF